MTYYKSILQIIKDPNHTEYKRVKLTEETIINNEHLCTLYLEPASKYECPICKSNNISCFGKKTRSFIDECYANHKTYVKLIYHRLKCNTCGKLFMDTLDFLKSKQSISLNLKLNILQDLKQDVSFTYIANNRNVSIQTVIDIFESFIAIDRTPFNDVLCMDEFKNLKHSYGKYAFLMYDPINQKIYDVLEDRRQDYIDTYLYHIDIKERAKVKYVITDMNESYRSIIKRHFYNATHIIDTFHYIRYVEDAFNTVRIRIQSLYKSNSKEYKVLKRNWRILSSYQLNLDDESSYNHIQQKNTPKNQIIADSLSVSKDLEQAYTLTQHFLYGIKNIKFEKSEKWLDDWLNEVDESGIVEFILLKKMFKNWKKEILNSFIRFGDSRLHNGHIEGINNHIKVIKRISYGYSNFTHFRNRIMYIINNPAITTLKFVDRTKIYRKPKKIN